MRIHCLLSLSLAASLCAQNEVLYYKFEGGGNKALNYAMNSPAPGEGPITNTLTTAPTTSFVPGRFGDALTSGTAVAPYQANVVDTGWAPSVTGDYTWAMWVNNLRGSPGPSLTYVAGIPVSGSFRIYGGSSTLLTVGNAGGTTYYRTLANIYQMASAGWVHVAFVVDTTAMTATYYVNGIAEPSVALTALPNISGPTFTIGRQNPTSAPSIYDIDEFRFLTRAATAGEILVWANANGAGSSSFGSGCDATMTTASTPAIGNLLYSLDVTAQAPNTVGFMALGLNRNNAGPIALPVDLGTFVSGMGGCPWECSNEVTHLMVLDAQGNGSLPFPIPPLPAFDGVQFYAQGIFVGGPRGLMSTNPVGMVLGN